MDQSSIDACPFESTKRSRFGQIGSFGSKYMVRFHRVYTRGASAIGVPGCPEFACCTASMERVRMVLIQSWSTVVSAVGSATSGTLMGCLLCLIGRLSVLRAKRPYRDGADAARPD